MTGLQFQGLSRLEAAERLAADGPNQLPGQAPKSNAAIVREVITEPMFLMLLAAGGIYLALGSRAEALFLLAFVFVVIGITMVQERRTQRALESLRDLSAPRALVQRDGQALRLDSRDVVRGDVLILREGDRIAADAQLLSGQLSVNESLLTGESVPVTKRPGPADWVAATSSGEPDPEVAPPGGDDTPWLFASTVVTQGSGLARVHAVAGTTAVGRIGAALSATEEPATTLQLDSRRLVRWLGTAAMGVAAALVLLGWGWDGRPLLDALLSGIALAMAILPEEIPVILTVFLALGAWRISRQQVLARRVSAVEALGAITVLAVDKTGTLTQNRMAVVELVAFEPAAGASALSAGIQALTEAAVRATPLDPFDPMEQAIRAFGVAHGVVEAGAAAVDTALANYPLSAELLAMTRVHPAIGAGVPTYVASTKGAPEAVADLCHLTSEQRAVVREQVLACAQRGWRVLGVAQASGPLPVARAGGQPDWPASQHDFSFTFLGLLALADPPRSDVPAAVAQCRDAGIRLIMMTGDHPATATAIAREVGLSDRPAVLTGADVDTLDDPALVERLRHTDLCARLQPVHKLRLVQALRAAGEVVAMTGDGVNDAPALKAADVGVAMGLHGTDVAREAAAVVLLDDSFASLVAAIRQGRRIDDNIAKATRFTMAVHLPVIALALVPALLHWPMLLLPVHIVLLELLIDPACSVVFEAEPEATGVMQRPPRGVGQSPFALVNLLQGWWQGLGVAAVLVSGYAVLAEVAPNEGPEQSRTAIFLALVVAVFLLTLANRDRLISLPGQGNPWVPRMGLAVAGLLTAVLAIPPVRQLMGLAWPDARAGLTMGAMVVGCGMWLAGGRIWRQRRRPTLDCVER